MEPTYPINYRVGWIQPADEYIPEVIPSKPQWITTSRLPDYGPVVEDDTQTNQNHQRTYQHISENAIHKTILRRKQNNRIRQRTHNL